MALPLPTCPLQALDSPGGKPPSFPPLPVSPTTEPLEVGSEGWTLATRWQTRVTLSLGPLELERGEGLSF